MNFGSYTNLTSLFTSIGNKLRKKVSFELVTQAEYNVLVQAGTVDPNVDYHIYNTSVTAAPIDDTDTALDKVWSSDKTSKSISNPNLIDNPCFTVNQRGQSTYAVTGTNEVYTVDRWSMVGWDNKTVTLNVGSDGIEFTAGVNSFRQNLDDIWEVLVGKTLTLSIDYTSADASGQIGIIRTNLWDANTIIPFKAGHNLDSITFVAESGTAPKLWTYIPDTNTSVKIKAVKLEIGSVSTLAMDTAPNYGIELAKCKTSTADISDTYANKGKLLATNDLVSTVLTVSTSSWVADTTSQSGTTLYKKEINLSHVYVPCPEVAIGASGTTLPTKAQQTAYDLIQYATVDSSTNKLYLYASALPSTQFYIKVIGVD